MAVATVPVRALDATRETAQRTTGEDLTRVQAAAHGHGTDDAGDDLGSIRGPGACECVSYSALPVLTTQRPERRGVEQTRGRSTSRGPLGRVADVIPVDLVL